MERSASKVTVPPGIDEKKSSIRTPDKKGEGTGQQRPPLAPSRSQMETKYMNMLLALDSIPRFHNLLAAFFTWILLAGFVLFPGTFNSLKNAQGDSTSPIGQHVLDVVSHVPLWVVHPRLVR
jgi:hypothetical protein